MSQQRDTVAEVAFVCILIITTSACLPNTRPNTPSINQRTLSPKATTSRSISKQTAKQSINPVIKSKSLTTTSSSLPPPPKSFLAAASSNPMIYVNGAGIFTGVRLASDQAPYSILQTSHIRKDPKQNKEHVNISEARPFQYYTASTSMNGGERWRSQWSLASTYGSLPVSILKRRRRSVVESNAKPYNAVGGNGAWSSTYSYPYTYNGRNYRNLKMNVMSDRKIKSKIIEKTNKIIRPHYYPEYVRNFDTNKYPITTSSSAASDGQKGKNYNIPYAKPEPEIKLINGNGNVYAKIPFYLMPHAYLLIPNYSYVDAPSVLNILPKNAQLQKYPVAVPEVTGEAVAAAERPYLAPVTEANEKILATAEESYPAAIPESSVETIAAAKAPYPAAVPEVIGEALAADKLPYQEAKPEVTRGAAAAAEIPYLAPVSEVIMKAIALPEAPYPADLPVTSAGEAVGAAQAPYPEAVQETDEKIIEAVETDIPAVVSEATGEEEVTAGIVPPQQAEGTVEAVEGPYLAPKPKVNEETNSEASYPAAVPEATGGAVAAAEVPYPAALPEGAGEAVAAAEAPYPAALSEAAGESVAAAEAPYPAAVPEATGGAVTAAEASYTAALPEAAGEAVAAAEAPYPAAVPEAAGEAVAAAEQQAVQKVIEGPVAAVEGPYLAPTPKDLSINSKNNSILAEIRL